MTTIAFIGAGSMAEAVIAGIVKHEVVARERVLVTNKSDAARLEQLQRTYGVTPYNTEDGTVKEADVVVFATKPNDVEAALRDNVAFIREDATVVSVIAGIPIQTFERVLPNNPIARVMPNTSATIGLSASGIAWNGKQSEAQYTFVHTLLSSIGLVKEVEEEQLHAVTALSGSGPAYVYYFVEALEKAAVAHGIDLTVARELTIQTLKGAAHMLEETKEEPSILRENVTSPGGTTAAGLAALRDASFEELIERCIERAKSRSIEIGNA